MRHNFAVVLTQNIMKKSVWFFLPKNVVEGSGTDICNKLAVAWSKEAISGGLSMDELLPGLLPLELSSGNSVFRLRSPSKIFPALISWCSWNHLAVLLELLAAWGSSSKSNSISRMLPLLLLLLIFLLLWFPSLPSLLPLPPPPEQPPRPPEDPP